MTLGDEETLRRDAAAWFARMQGPGAETARADFDAWRAIAVHQQAYDRLVQRFEDSAILGHSRLSALRLRTTAARRGPPPAVWWTAAAAGLVLAALGLSQIQPTRDAVDGQRTFASAPGQIRTVAVAPGVTVTLDTDAIVSASKTGERLHLVLEQGRARIQSAGPLEVDAGATRVLAGRGAFDLTRRTGQDVEVAALDGVLEAKSRSGLLHRERTKLQAGQRLILAGGRAGQPTPALARDRQWPTGLLFFDAAPLEQVLAEANRYGAQKIRLADPQLARLQVSGGLKVTDPNELARALAAALSLNVGAEPGGDLVLSHAGA